jgi:hypothetical protein
VFVEAFGGRFGFLSLSALSKGKFGVIFGNEPEVVRGSMVSKFTGTPAVVSTKRRPSATAVFNATKFVLITASG